MGGLPLPANGRTALIKHLQLSARRKTLVIAQQLWTMAAGLISSPALPGQQPQGFPSFKSSILTDVLTKHLRIP